MYQVSCPHFKRNEALSYCAKSSAYLQALARLVLCRVHVILVLERIWMHAQECAFAYVHAYNNHVAQPRDCKNNARACLQLIHSAKSQGAKLAASLLWPVIGQSRYKNYCQIYTLLGLKTSHRCLFCTCTSRVHQEAKKAEISKCRNFWTKHFQQIPHISFVKFATRSLMTPCFLPINKVCSS